MQLIEPKRCWAMGVLISSLILGGCLEKKDMQQSALVDAAGSLRTTVKVNGRALAGQNGVYLMTNKARVVIECTLDCTFLVQQGGAQLLQAQAHIAPRRWEGEVFFPSQEDVLKVTAQAKGQSPVVMVLRSSEVKAAANAQGSWRLDGMSWQRGKSLQQAFPATGTPGSVPWFGVTMESADMALASCSQTAPCSIVSMTVTGTVAPGDYAADSYWLSNPTQKPEGIRINIKVVAGLGSEQQADYRPVSGTMRVTQDGAGAYRYNTLGNITVQRMPSSGMSHLPQRMTFAMYNGN